MAIDPDVWWGADGIDALIWADGPPYVHPDQIVVCEGQPCPR